jgi:hypothetical protein
LYEVRIPKHLNPALLLKEKGDARTLSFRRGQGEVFQLSFHIKRFSGVETRMTRKGGALN